MNAITDPSVTIDLAHEQDFRLGGLLVRPSVCRVAAAGRETRVEPRVMEVLVRLTRSLNQTVTRDELIESCWGGRFIGDDAVSRVIYQMRGLARGVEPAPFVLETVPKVGFRLVADAVTSDETARPGAPAPPPDHRGASRAALSRPLVAGALALALVAVMAGLAWKLSHPGVPAVRPGRIEVMQFEPLQQEPALRRFAVSLGDAVARVLSANGVDTAQRPMRRDADDREGRAEFRVAGTIDHDGDKYVINAQVLDRRLGDVLWSRRFERDAAVPMAFQEEAANVIGDTLYCALWHRTASRRAMAPTLFSLFMNACAERRGTHGGTPMKFVEMTERIVREAPDNSYAHSFNAEAHAVAASDDLAGATGAASQADAAAAAARRALRLDPRNGEAYQALAVRYNGRGRWLEREQNILRSVALTPNLPHGRAYYPGLLREVGRLSEAAEVNQRSIASDPFSAGQLATLALMRGADGDFPEVDALLRKMELLDRDMALEIRYLVAFWWRDPGKALAELHPYPRLPDAIFACHHAYLARLAQAHGAPLRGLPSQCEAANAYGVRMLAREGDIDGAYTALALKPEIYRYPTLFYYPEMRAFRRDPRFMPLAYRIGLVDYWMKDGHWPDFCAEPDLPYDCKQVAKALTPPGAGSGKASARG